MKQTVLVLLLFYSFLSYSQSIVKSSVDAGGSFFSNETTQVLFTIGETLVREINIGSINVSEGFINTTESHGLNLLAYAALNDIKVSPNPTHGILSINGDTSKIISIEIYSLLGAKLMVMKNDFREINLEAFENAVYFVKLNTINSTKTIKIVKQ